MSQELDRRGMPIFREASASGSKRGPVLPKKHIKNFSLNFGNIKKLEETKLSQQQIHQPIFSSGPQKQPSQKHQELKERLRQMAQ